MAMRDQHGRFVKGSGSGAGDGAHLTGDWHGATERIKSLVPTLRERIQLATRQSALGLEGAIKEGIESQAPGGVPYPALHPFTIAMRLSQLSARSRAKVNARAAEMEAGGQSGHKALQNHGDLMGAITHQISSDGLSAAVGVSRKAKDRDGKPVIDIARVVFNGCVIAVTTRMRMFLHGQGLHLKASTTHIVIPPRPTIEPVYRQYRPTIIERYRKALQEAVKP